MERIFTDIQDFGDENDLDDNDLREQSNKFQQRRGATIFLIDAREKMFLPSFEETAVPFMLCLKCVKNAIRHKIFSLEKCFCSVVLLGTKKTDNSLNLNNISVVQELDMLGAQHIMKIEEVMRAVDNNSYKEEYGFEKFSLGDAFWLSFNFFNQRSQNLNKTIVYFTNDDNPTSNVQNDESRAIACAQDMYKSFITFDFFHLGEDFDVNKFYKKIILASHNDPNYSIPESVTSGDEILRRISKSKYKHVSFIKLPFVITKDFEIGVSIHFLVSKMKVPFKIKLSKATNERVVGKMQYFESETGSLVKPDDIIKSQTIGLQDINFTPAELKSIFEIGKSGLHLLGFKPASFLRLENYVKPCAFIYPDDSKYKGSSMFFTALLKRCIAKQVIAICTLCVRSTSACRFVALIAQEEFLSEDKNQELPSGFVVFFLPFAEEVRAINDKITKRAEPEDVEIAAQLIKKLKFTYRAKSFQNPKLKTHWAAIEALALDLNEPEEVHDSTIPNYDMMSARTGKIAKKFIQSVYPEDYNPESFQPRKKPNISKKVVEEDLDVEEVAEMVRDDKGALLSNDRLKNYLASVGKGRGLSKMKKADLLEKVREHLKLN